MTSKSKLSVVIDIGTSKFVAVAGTKNEAGKLDIAGIVKTESKGIKRGVVYNIEEVAASIQELIRQLETKLGESVESVQVAYAGQHMKTIHFQRSRFTSDEGIVSKFDVDNLMEQAKSCELEEGYKLIEVIPVAFLVDDEMIQRNPVGITGRRIEAHFKLLVIPNSYWLNLKRVFDKIGVELDGLTFSILAVAEAIVTRDEKEMGVIVVDIGCGTTKMAVYHENRLVHTAAIPFGGDVVTNDIKEGCSILLKHAEQLKVKYGQALGDFADDQKVVTIPGHNGWEPKEISFRSLAFIIQARIEEIVDSINFQIQKAGVENLVGAGIVLTGGTSNLENIVALVKYRTGLDVRKANLVLGFNERNKDFQQSDFYTALGLLNLAEKKISPAAPQPVKIKKEKAPKEPGKLSQRFNNFVQGVLNLVDDDSEDIALN
ncbi:MAG: cell division protein FtsA [Draconibacterium sp.]